MHFKPWLLGALGLAFSPALHAAPRYVAMGSSYAAGPGVTTTAPRSLSR
jgi:hypothetical protein